jgi:hypothetical protein
VNSIYDFRILPGVVDVRPNDPEPGWVTLIVRPGCEGWYADETGTTGVYRIGLRVRTRVQGKYPF